MRERAAGAPGALHAERMEEGESATTLELFFDLVFVFALTQVTALMAHDLTGTGLVRGLLVVALLWWSWVCFVWLCNVVRADEGAVRLITLAAMGALFVLALSIPEAFHDLPGGLSGPAVVASAYFAFRLLHLALFWVVARGDDALRRQLTRFAPSVAGGTVLLAAAVLAEGPVQTLLWAAALAADYGGTFLGGTGGWRLRSASHFAERHGLILIVALGESIVAIGVGVAEEPVSVAVLVAAVGGLALASTLWWTYFDTTSLLAEQQLERSTGEERPRLARDAYSYLHFPLVAGIVLSALGLKEVLGRVAHTDEHGPGAALSGLGLLSLTTGVGLYLLGCALLRRRVTGHVPWLQVAAAGATAALAPALLGMPALLALAAVTTVAVATVTADAVRWAGHRHTIRAHHRARHGSEPDPSYRSPG